MTHSTATRIFDNYIDYGNYVEYGLNKAFSKRELELLEQGQVRLSNKIIIKTGNVVELFIYQRPVSYNWIDKGNKGGIRQKKETRREDSIYRSQSHIRRIVEGNAWAYGYMPIFFTFTFRDQINDLKTANYEWSKAVDRFKRRFKFKPRFLNVVEFQKNGRVHYHCLMFDLPFVYGIKEIIAEVWGQGFVNVTSIRHVKRLGKYVSKYMTKETLDNRLVGQKSYFCSRHVFQPIKIRNEETIDTMLNSDMLELTYDKSYKSESYGLIEYKIYKCCTKLK